MGKVKVFKTTLSDAYFADASHRAEVEGRVAEIFQKRIPLAPWYYTMSLGGDWSIVSMQQLGDALIRDILEQGGDQDDLVLDYSPAKTFSEAKRHLIGVLEDEISELKSSLILLRSYKKPKVSKRDWKKK